MYCLFDIFHTANTNPYSNKISNNFKGVNFKLAWQDNSIFALLTIKLEYPLAMATFLVYVPNTQVYLILPWRQKDIQNYLFLTFKVLQITMFIHVFFLPNTIPVGSIITCTWLHILANLFSCCLIKYNIIFPTIFFWLELILWSFRFVCVLCYTWQHFFTCPKGQFKQIMVNYILNQGWFCLFV